LGWIGLESSVKREKVELDLVMKKISKKGVPDQSFGLDCHLGFFYFIVLLFLWIFGRIEGSFGWIIGIREWPKGLEI
jgi:hypothetical protein